MFHWKPALAGATGIAGAGLLAMATAAHADVKAGVDAWSAGDYARAVAEWRAPAAKGDADALFNLAQAYRLGRGVSEDPRQAETYYARAAAKGHLKAADNYGLLLFQDGRREQAMPYITAAAERGDPRAQYLLGIAHFNGDLAEKDWVRAYALLTLANGAGLPQAAPAIREMDEHIPLAQRQRAQTLAASIRSSADAARSSQMAAADLGEGGPVAVIDAPADRAAAPQQAALPSARLPQAIKAVAVPPSISAAEAAVSEAMRATGTESPATAGADYVRAGRPGTAPAPESVARATAETAPSRSVRAEPAAEQKPAASGPWKLQLGAFSVSGNADRAWTLVASVPALAGKSKQLAPAGRLTKLLAAGWPTQSAAQGACNTLKASGHACIVTR